MATSPADRKRAYRLRKNRGQMSAEDVAWLAEYDATKSTRGRRPAVTVEAGEADGNVRAEQGADQPSAPDVDAPDAGDVGAPPPPPRVDFDPRAGGKDKKQDDPGRDAVVDLVSSNWVGALAALQAQIREVGGRPILDVDTIAPHIRVTVDQLLPPRVRLSSSMIAAFGTTSTLGQRIYHHGRIVELHNARVGKDGGSDTVGKEVNPSGSAPHVAKAPDAVATEAQPQPPATQPADNGHAGDPAQAMTVRSVDRSWIDMTSPFA